MQGSDRVVLCIFGEGAVNNGVFLESLNLANLWSMPVVYVFENNRYATSVPYTKASGMPDIASRASAYNLPGAAVDGQDAFAVAQAVEEKSVELEPVTGRA